MSDILEQLKKTKQASYNLASLDEKQRNAVLLALAEKLRASISDVVAANKKDLAALPKEDPMYDRLLLNELRLNAIAGEVENVAALPSPLGKELAAWEMPNKLHISKLCVPLGVVAVIYESRPNVTIDVFTLCFKTGNACVLKGGKEAMHSNQALVKIIHAVLAEHSIDSSIVLLFPPSREETSLLLGATGLIDVCIPRGSQQLIDYVRANAKIPVIETGAGIVHVYFDAAGDLDKGQQIVNNSKTRRVSVCNALDCLLIHNSRINDLEALIEPLIEHEVEIYADDAAFAALQGAYPSKLLLHAKEDDFGKEFLAYKMAIKTVDSVQNAVQHIMHYTSGHSEAIVTEDNKTADYFTQNVDAAVVYVNASTAFTDGAQFGMGAEIGISTQKLHARGPMALDALTSYKWIVHGDGQIRP